MTLMYRFGYGPARLAAFRACMVLRTSPVGNSPNFAPRGFSEVRRPVVHVGQEKIAHTGDVPCVARDVCCTRIHRTGGL